MGYKSWFVIVIVLVISGLSVSQVQPIPDLKEEDKKQQHQLEGGLDQVSLALQAAATFPFGNLFGGKCGFDTALDARYDDNSLLKNVTLAQNANGNANLTDIARSVDVDITQWSGEIFEVIIKGNVGFASQETSGDDNWIEIMFSDTVNIAANSDTLKIRIMANHGGNYDAGQAANDLYVMVQWTNGASLDTAYGWLTPTDNTNFWAKITIIWDTYQVDGYDSDDGVTYSSSRFTDFLNSLAQPNEDFVAAILSMERRGATDTVEVQYIDFTNDNITIIDTPIAFGSPYTPETLVAAANTAAGSTVFTYVASISEHPIGIGGFGTVKIHNKNYANLNTLRSYEKQTLYIVDSSNVVRFRGIIEQLTTEWTKEEGHIISVACSHISNKLLKQRCNTNPLLLPFTSAKWIGDETHKNHQAIYDAAWVNDFASFIQRDYLTRKYNIVESDITNAHGSATEELRGAVSNTYFDDGERYGHLPSSAGNADYTAADYSNSQEWEHEFTFVIYKKSNTDWDKVTIDLIFQFDTNGVAASTQGKLEIYNDTTTTWETVFTAWASDDLYEVTYDITDDIGTIGDYMNTIGGANASGFVKHELKMRINAGSDSSDAAYMRVAIYYALVTCVYDLPQYAELGQALISGVTAQVLTYDNTTPAWGLNGFPLSDGFCFDDLVAVSKPLDEILTDIFTNADTAFTFTENATDIETITEVTDLTHVSLGAFLKKISNILNAVFVINLEDLEISLTSADNIADVAEGTIITHHDIIGGIGGIKFTESVIDVYTNITGRGKATYITDVSGTSITEDDGDTDLVKAWPNLLSIKQLRDKIDSIKAQHASAKESVKFKVNPDTAVFPVTGYIAGAKIPLKLPNATDSNIGNYTTGNDGQLVVRSVTYAIRREYEEYEIRAHLRL